MSLRISLLLLLGAIAAFSQTAAPTFDVASVKANRTNESGSQTNSDRTYFRAVNASLRSLILLAWDIRDSQLTGGPSWVATDPWDVNAKPEAELPRGEEGSALLRGMLQSLLAERFHLAVHKEQREMTVYSLTVGKSGSKLVPAAPAENSGTSTSNGTMKATNVSLAQLARNLSGRVGRLVIDETGIAGKFDFRLEFAPDNGKPILLNGQEVDRPDIFTALQDQLGLKLESRKAPVEVIVIDKAERATEN